MKQGITINPCHARSVRPDTSEYIFTFRKVMLSFSPSSLISPIGYFVCLRGAERYAPRLGGLPITVIVAQVTIACGGRNMEMQLS